jgi:hypothetical protein
VEPKVRLRVFAKRGAQHTLNEVGCRLETFAVPVVKDHAGKDYPIQNERVHLLILSISPQDMEKKVRLQNQFIPNDVMVNVVRRVMLAVPSIEHDWKAV